MKPVQVTHVITRMVRGGAQNVVLQLAERVDRSRFRTEVICGEEEPTMLSELERSVPVRRVSWMIRDISPRRDAGALASLFARFRRAPHVVHGHTYKAGVLSAVAARMAGVPAVVFSPHGHIFTPDAGIPGVPHGLKLRFLRGLTRLAQSCAHAVVALSDEDLEEQLQHALSPRSKYVVIRNGVDVLRFSREDRRSVRRKWGFKGSPVIGSIGRLTTEKGHRFLLPMLSRISGAVLAIAGDGPERDRIMAEARRENVSGRVRMLGEVDSAEVLPAFDVYVQPSLYEGQGIAILEAMAARVPVVATRVGGVTGVVRHERTGLLVPSADPGAMADSVLRLRRDRMLAESLAAAASRMVTRYFSVDRMVREYEQLYLRLLRR